jgi:hypothetical protein
MEQPFYTVIYQCFPALEAFSQNQAAILAVLNGACVIAALAGGQKAKRPAL